MATHKAPLTVYWPSMAERARQWSRKISVETRLAVVLTAAIAASLYAELSGALAAVGR